jgi:DNA-binding transcriptional LysR family regulator
MNKKDFLNLYGLLSLETINECHCKKKAAEKLNVSQDTLNKYIDTLESYIGTQLITSSTKGCLLTPKGSELLSCVDKINLVLGDMGNQRATLDDGYSEVRLYLPLTAGIFIFPYHLEDFFSHYPTLKLIICSSLELLSPDSLGVDVGISYAKPELNSKMSEISTCSVPFGLFAAKDYITRHGMPFDVADMLANHRLINQVRTPLLMPQWQQYLSEAKHLVLETNSVFDLAEAVKSGVGIGILPLHNTDTSLVHLKHIPFDDELVFYLLANPKTKDIPRVRCVINLCRQIMTSF